MIGVLLAVTAAMTLVMGAGWLFQRAAANAGWADVFWTFGAGVTCALAALAPFGGRAGPAWRQALVAALVAIWALRLGGYLARRVARGPEDVRYAGLRRHWGEAFQARMFLLMIVQAPAAGLLALSVLLAARNPQPTLRAADLIGAGVLALAVAGEALADAQMKQFKATAAPGAVCDVGLWAWSRHPNYFFEALGWLAYPVIAVEPTRPLTWASLAAPVAMFALLRFATGVPPLEAAMLRSKGGAYGRYQQRVSAMLPWPPKETPA